MPSQKSTLLVRLQPKAAGQFRAVARASLLSNSALLERIVLDFLDRPGVQALAGMTIEERVMHQIDNQRAGRKPNEGIEMGLDH